MKFHASGGTHFGDLVLFWPEQLPTDFDELFAEDADDLIEQLRDAGKLLLLPSATNGEFHLALFVNEPIPQELENYCTLAAKHETLQVTGDGYFCGIEFMFRHDRSLLDKQPRMGTAVQVPAGTYFAEVFATDVPDDVYENWLREQAGEGAQRLWWVQTWFASVGIVALMVCVGCLFVGTRNAVIATAVVAAGLLAVAWLMAKTASYERVQQARREYVKNYPHYVIRLR
jgi:hypothetical protein